ncbi:EmrB/QacA subfamily drug resistance transporter [Homoserinimonas aerilata]|uniref:EmrB/QacA subfamily drug resistance transporter n=1 Tax=Homoserinimonas aerilata TaxID=1162970 RepID=A0A542YKH7_9MICO|nr:MDR family MFS transporter [Homoserinimonas aerilata]TQL48571.1 EmrB/QacA subfamily drug resistance transporter [Homoserinimonas aerilata]
MQINSETAETSAPAPTSQSGERKSSLLLVFIGLMLAMFLSSLSQTVLSAAMPTMVGELNGVDHMLWIMTAFMLSSTIMMPIYGKMGDLIGRKSLLIAAILVFMVGSVIGALAGDMTMMIAARVVQGIGGGGLMILSQAIIADVVPARERGRYMGIMGAVFAVSSVAGPLLGGWLTEGVGWRWTFWINIPVGLLALGAAVFLLHLPKHRSVRPKIDGWGMALLAFATTCLVLVGSWGGKDFAWDSITILGLIAATVISAVIFVLVERRVAEPIMPLHLFKDRNFNLTTGAGLLTGIAMFGAIGYLPTYLQMTFGADATQAGLLMIPMMGALLITSVATGSLVSRYGRYKWMPIVGAAIIAVGLALLSTITPDMPIWQFCLYLAVLGMGLGTSMQILVLIVQNSFPNSEVGTATASNNYFRQIGGSLGGAVVGSLFTTRLADELTRRFAGMGGASGSADINSLTPDGIKHLPDAIHQQIVEGYNEALAPLFLYMVPLAILAFVLLLFVKEKPLATTIERDIMPDSVAEGQLLITSSQKTV